jgi:hypothetical protein
MDRPSPDVGSLHRCWTDRKHPCALARPLFVLLRRAPPASDRPAQRPADAVGDVGATPEIRP